jgi:hypothetical protein
LEPLIVDWDVVIRAPWRGWWTRHGQPGETTAQNATAGVKADWMFRMTPAHMPPLIQQRRQSTIKLNLLLFMKIILSRRGGIAAARAALRTWASRL